MSGRIVGDGYEIQFEGPAQLLPPEGTPMSLVVRHGTGAAVGDTVDVHAVTMGRVITREEWEAMRVEREATEKQLRREELAAVIANRGALTDLELADAIMEHLRDEFYE